MDIYILDNLLRRIDVIDQYVSLIWTERFSNYGDFELVIHSTPETRSRLPVGTRLVINDSYRIMEVETSLDKTGADGNLLTVSGRSMESILEQRVTRRPVGDQPAAEWILADRPGDLARFMFRTMCVVNEFYPEDVIPFYSPGSIYPDGTIPETGAVIELTVGMDTLFAFIKNLCDLYGLGFRLIRNPETCRLHFDIYTGNDRTSQQNIMAPVLFSQDLDNLNDVSELVSDANYKNVAYVFAKNGSEVVYSDSANPQTSGFDRRVLIVDASDVDEEAGVSLSGILTRKGLDALAENRRIMAFDGELPRSSKYKYGKHYDLGDLVEMRKSNGATNQMRVTEQIFVSDAEGVRSYPTLAVELYITPGSWFSWDANDTWEDATGTWDEA